MNILTIDPGLNGFLCVGEVQNLEFVPIESFSIPTIKVKVNKKNKNKVDEIQLAITIHTLIEKYNIQEVIIEKQQVISSRNIPGVDSVTSTSREQGIVSSASTMEHFGWLKGFCDGKNIKRTSVAAKTWQSVYPNEIKKNKEFNPKDKSKTYCQYLFPTLDLRKNKRCRNISDGKTDSILIGVWRAKQVNQ